MDPRLDSLAWLEMTIRGNCVPSRIGRRSDASQSGHRNHWTIRGNLARSNRGLFSTCYRLKKKGDPGAVVDPRLDLLAWLNG